MENKERLDSYLVKKGFVPSRSKAAELISNGKVKVNDKIITKNSFEVSDEANIEILNNEVLKYVSRGGLKLQKAIECFNLDLTDKVILDIGSSTGGFTDCALKHNAKKVYALDVGTDQLHESLRNDERVVSIENTNFKDATNELFDEKIDLYVCDVSFISIQTILAKLKQLDENFHIIILFKPQFEVGKNNLNKNGVAKNKMCIVGALIDFYSFLNALNIGIKNATFSPIIGQKEGNVEFLFELKTNEKSIHVSFTKLVAEAYNSLKVK